MSLEWVLWLFVRGMIWLNVFSAVWVWCSVVGCGVLCCGWNRVWRFPLSVVRLKMNIYNLYNYDTITHLSSRSLNYGTTKGLATTSKARALASPLVASHS